IFSVKTVVLGGEFRVTTVIPFKGNLADYHHLEITRPVSLVGGALTTDVADRQVGKIKSQFEEKRIFESLTVTYSYSATAAGQTPKPHRDDSFNTNADSADPLDSPIAGYSTMEARDRQRALQNDKPETPSNRTLVTVIEVLDYAKGSRIKQALPLD